jgi:hypothetical protein
MKDGGTSGAFGGAWWGSAGYSAFFQGAKFPSPRFYGSCLEGETPACLYLGNYPRKILSLSGGFPFVIRFPSTGLFAVLRVEARIMIPLNLPVTLHSFQKPLSKSFLSTF